MSRLATAGLRREKSWIDVGSGCEAMWVCKEAGREARERLCGNEVEATPFRVWRCIGAFPVDGCIGSTAEWLTWRFDMTGKVRRGGGIDKAGMSVEIAVLRDFSVSTVSLLEGSGAGDGRNWKGTDFFDAFDWKTFDDPTHGRVNYIDLPTAQSQNLSWADESTFVLRGDAFKQVQSGSRGRDSVRIHSKDTFGDGLLVIDATHMPQGCGTWPAFWTCNRDDWPAGGEIDIVEGVNGQGHNLGSLHTTQGCFMPATGRNMTGDMRSNDCGGSNQGCGVNDKRPTSFGPSFNSIGGGIYAMKRDANQAIAFWFWPRDDNSVPQDISSAALTVDESTWGTPWAVLPSSSSCNLTSYLSNHEIILNLTFCGGWGNNTWHGSGCEASTGMTCDAFVDQNPSQFTEAYWEIKGIRWYDAQR
nr:hypothetical protein L204_03798 [Cryptococcus depauperatus CBS 7855]